MPLTNPNKVVTEERLNEYHKKILPYLGGNSMVACGGGYAPIGTVISYMGTRAPSDFLICDGTVYNIADYTELADFFEAQFGSSNFFGGDGNTTFAVPDLRGEFLRGTGTNSHANQGSGANVGVHQDGTEHTSFSSGEGYLQANRSVVAPTYEMNTNADFSKPRSHIYYTNEKVVSENVSSGTGLYTSRPTNTSVLYCIKAKSQGNGYSLDEQIVGTWIDGKPIYQKTFTGEGTINITANTWTYLENYFLMSASFLNGIDWFVDVKMNRASNVITMATNIMVENGKFGIWAVVADIITNGVVTLRYTKNN